MVRGTDPDVVAAAIETRLRARGQSAALAILVAAVVASVLFGLCHYAHSPPFDTPRMIGLLTVVAFFTSAFFFVGRDVAGTIVFHNFLGTFGVARALHQANALQAFERLRWPLIVMAVVAAALVAAGYFWLGRTGHAGRPGRAIA